MSQPELPLDLSNAKHAAQPVSTLPDQARLRRPVRNQVEMMLRDLDSLIAEDHPVRAIWDFLQRLDLSDFYSSIRAVLDAPGRPASDPHADKSALDLCHGGWCGNGETPGPPLPGT